MEIFLVITLCVMIILLYVTYTLYGKYRKLKEYVEQEAVDSQETLEDSKRFFGRILEETQGAYKNMRSIDKREVFKGDDEVGITFDIIKRNVDDLHYFIENINNQLKNGGEAINVKEKEKEE